jgi:hypothetical protein
MTSSPKTIPGTVPKRRKGASERRNAERITFSAVAEIMNAGSSIRINARVSDISHTGCYLDAFNVLAAGTKIWITIRHGNQQFDSAASVVYTLPDMGMGVAFTSIEPEMLLLLDKWISEVGGEVARHGCATAVHQMTGRHAPRERDVLRRLVELLMSKNILTEDEGTCLLDVSHRES